MVRQTVLRAIALAIALAPLHAQLYVIAGSPTTYHTQKFGAALLRVGDDGNVQTIVELASESAGTGWTTVSEDARKAILLPGGGGPITVIDFASATVAKACEAPNVPGSVIDHWLVLSPSRGLTFVRYVAPDYVSTNNHLVGMLVEESIPCEKSFFDVDASDLRGLLAHGRTGVADTGSTTDMMVSMDSAGKIFRRMSGMSIPFPYEVPEAMRVGIEQPLARILIDNSHVMALGLFEGTPGERTHRILAYRKSDQTWHRVPVPYDRVMDAGNSTPTPWATGFGNFIALTEVRTKNAQNPESAGKAEWRKTNGKRGPGMAERFQDSDFVYPGRLHIYDVETGQSYLIVTNQGDSEVLLIDKNQVYYRVNDSIYQVSIDEKALGTPRLLAKSDALRDAHWAFLRRP